MQKLEKRIAALETKINAEASNFTVVETFPKDGETHDDAIRKAGHDPDAPNTLFICFVALKSH